MENSDIDLTASYRFLYPRLTVIVTSGTMKEPSALTIAWSTPLSVNPPLIGILIAPDRYSHGIITKTNSFVVNVPHFDLVEPTHYVGRISGRDEPDKIQKAGFTLEPSQTIKAPRIKECRITLGCKLVEIVTTGDHDIFIGEVVERKIDPTILDDWSYDLSKHVSIYWRQSKYAKETYYLDIEKEADSP
jgi:flavin reductase (DIM6/NTAB) family NADH-FMN oxidoreductase RutF